MTDVKNNLVFNELTESQLDEMKNNGTVPKNETFYTIEEDISITLHNTTGQDAEGIMTQKAITDALEQRVANTTTVNDKPLSSNIVLSADDVNALPSTTKYGYSISLSIDSSTYVITAQLKDQNGSSIGSPATIDLPLESVVVSGSYNSTTKEVVLTLEGGSTVKFSVADLVNGLASQSDLDAAVAAINSLSSQVSIKYAKPSTGIPKTDLDSNVQASLNKADTALQSVPSEYVTETELAAKDYETKANVEEKVRLLSDSISTINSVVSSIEEKNTQQDTDISGKLSKSGDTLGGPLKATGGDSSTAGKIILDETNKGQITNSMTGTLLGFTNTSDFTVGHSSYNLVMRGKTTRPKYNGNDLALYTDASNKQETLVSGTNIKTINGNSILGSGNIEVAASGGSKVTFRRWS